MKFVTDDIKIVLSFDLRNKILKSSTYFPGSVLPTVVEPSKQFAPELGVDSYPEPHVIIRTRSRQINTIMYYKLQI